MHVTSYFRLLEAFLDLDLPELLGRHQGEPLSAAAEIIAQLVDGNFYTFVPCQNY